MKRLAKLLAILTAVIFAAAFATYYAVTEPFVHKANVTVPAFSAAALQHTVEAIASSPHDYHEVARLAQIAADIHAHFATLPGGQIAEQTYVVKGNPYRNVGVLFGNPQDRIVIGAHYDAQGPGARLGADDNASGVAVLLELARVLAAQKPAFLSRVGVEFVAYCLEEDPRFRGDDMGSAYHAQAMRDAGVNIVAMMSLEMLGYYSDAPDSQHFPLPQLRFIYSSVGNAIVIVGKLGEGGIVRKTKSGFLGASDLPVFSINAPRAIPGIDFSDHQSYWNRGYPALMITDTAFYRNPNYHTVRDLPGTLDYDKMAKVAAGVYAAIGELAK